jgi:hypothetical protein
VAVTVVGAEPADHSAAVATTAARAVAVQSLAMAVRVMRGLLRANRMGVGMPDQLPVFDVHMA